MFTNYIYGQGDFQTRQVYIMTLSMVVYTVHVTCQDIDGGASAPVGPSVATPLGVTNI